MKAEAVDPLQAFSFREEMVALSLEHETAQMPRAIFEALAELGDRAEAAGARASSHEACSLASCLAWSEVSALQEQIAALLPARTYAGAAPRIGAVLAALASGDALRTWALVARYQEEDIDPEARAQLTGLGEEAMVLYEGIRQGGAVSFVSVGETA